MHTSLKYNPSPAPPTPVRMRASASLPHYISGGTQKKVVHIPSPGRVQAPKASTCFGLLEGGSYGLLLPASSHLFLLWKTCRRRRRPSARHVLHLIAFLQLSQRRVHQDASARLKFVFFFLPPSLRKRADLYLRDTVCGWKLEQRDPVAGCRSSTLIWLTIVLGSFKDSPRICPHH